MIEEKKEEEERDSQKEARVVETEEGKDGSFYEDCVDRRGINRNVNGFEEPHGPNPELWNIDGCEVDLTAKYKLGGQMWYLQSRALEHSEKGESIPGVPMSAVAKDSGRV